MFWSIGGKKKKKKQVLSCDHETLVHSRVKGSVNGDLDGWGDVGKLLTYTGLCAH